MNAGHAICVCLFNLLGVRINLLLIRHKFREKRCLTQYRISEEILLLKLYESRFSNMKTTENKSSGDSGSNLLFNVCFSASFKNYAMMTSYFIVSIIKIIYMRLRVEWGVTRLKSAIKIPMSAKGQLVPNSGFDPVWQWILIIPTDIWP